MSHNIDPVEIAKFEAKAGFWWDPKGKLKSLHDINPLRLGYIDGRHSLSGKKVLDVGCGGGLLSEAMARAGAQVTGIDMSQAPLSAAMAHMRISGVPIDYRLSTAEDFASAFPHSFDVVTCMELLEHVPDPGSVVRACGRLVKPGGSVFFATLNRNIKSFLFVIVAAEYLLGMLERGTHTWRRFIKPSELTVWGEEVGLSCRDLTGLHYNLLTHRYSLGGDLHTNYLAHLIKY